MELEFILSHCFCARSFGDYYSPFDIVPDGVNPALAFIKLPAEYLSLTQQAAPFIDAEINKYTAPKLIYMAPASQMFQGVEGLIAYTDGMRSLKYGYQVKTGDRQNVAVFNSSELDRTYLFRGQVKSRKPKVSTQKAGWKYLSVKEIRDFIGASLQLEVPPFN